MSILVPLDDHDLDREEIAFEAALAAAEARGEAILDESLRARAEAWSI